MASRGISELKRHFQREHHLRLHQQYCELYFPKDVRGRGAPVLYGEIREKEKQILLEYEVPELDTKRPFNDDVFEGKPFIFKLERDRVSTQIQPMMTFLKSTGELWGL